MIPIYLDPKNSNRIVAIPYSPLHKKYFSFSEYFLKQKNLKSTLMTIKKFCSTVKSNHKPDGFIFHTGRTGSTLLVKMLNSLDSVEVFSEIDILTDVLIERPKASNKKDDLNLVKKIIQSYLSQVSPDRKVIFKFTSIDTLSIRRLLQIYPNVPSVYVFNSPDAILSSQFFRPPRWSTHLGRILFKLKIDALPEQNNKFIAEQSLILNASYKLALKTKNKKNIMYIDYHSLLKPKIFDVFNWFGISTNKSERQLIQSVKQFDSKRPNQKFSKKTQQERAPILDEKFIFGRKSLWINYKKLLKAVK